jgi:hypothetical protein
MNLRHTAAVALLGWYLMTPPVHYDYSVDKKGHQVVDDGEPLSKWKVAMAFDTARLCNEAYVAWREKVIKSKEDSDVLYSQCIATR